MVASSSSYLIIGKQYTLTVSNEIAEKRLDGRDQSTLLYEYSFETTKGPLKKYLKWDEFKPMYRGKPKEDAPGLDLGNIRRWSFMIRSFFDKQYGEFSMTINCVCAFEEEKGSSECEASALEAKTDVGNGNGKWCLVQ